MDDRFNTIAGWALFSGIVALGLSSLSAKYFEADKAHRPHKMGYEIEGVVSSEGGAAEVPIETLLATADVAKGEQVFKKCTSCHTIDAGGANGIGPNLHGVVGEAIGTGQAGYAFSTALSGHGGTWDWKNLSDWLHNPKKFASGTKMTFAGLGNAEDRANVIAYLNTQGPNLPLPTAAAAPAAGASEAAPAASEGAAATGGANKVDASAAGAVAQPAPGTGPAPAQDKSTVSAH
jgi:cytochrome c